MSSYGLSTTSNLPTTTSVVDASAIKESQVFGAQKVTEREILTWEVAESPEGPFTEYTWELLPVNEDTFTYLESRGIATDWWWQEDVESGRDGSVRSTYPTIQWYGYKSILLPMNEAALEVHREIGLRLPDDFELSEE